MLKSQIIGTAWKSLMGHRTSLRLESTKTLGVLLLTLSGSLAAGCSGVELILRQSPARAEARLEEGRIAVAKTRTLEENFEDPFKAFEAGVSVSHLYMAGGYIVAKTERGMQYRSKRIEVKDRKRYQKLGTQWLDRAVANAMTWRRIEVNKIDRVEALPTLTFRELRGSGPHDLRDNQNLPGFELEAKPLSKEQREALPDLHGATLLLQPYLVNYYSHNGGWFLGQNYGTGAGARIRLFWVLWDTVDGRVLRWGALSGRHVEDHVFSPNSTQIDDYLLMLEEALGKKLEHRMLR